jgi:HEAT repeat protein
VDAAAGAIYPLVIMDGHESRALVLAVAALCAAAPPARGAVEFECEIHPGPEGTEVVVVRGDETLRRAVPAGSWDAGGLACHPFDDHAVRVVVPGDGERAFELFVGVQAGGSLTVVWEGKTGLAGEYGERWGWFLDAEPVNPGGDEEVPILYMLNEQVELCGHGMVPLWVRMYDPASQTFRPIGFDRLRRAGTGWGGGAAPSSTSGSSTKTKVVSTIPTSPPAPPVLEEFLRFRGSSSSLADGADPGLVRAPLELADGDPASGWIEGVGGYGWGEFVTATTADARIPITSLTLGLARGDTPHEARSLNRVRRLDVVTDGGSVFAVKIPVDPAKHPDRPVVVALPAPVTTSCVSVVIRDVYPAKGGGDNTFIGEVTAYSSLDSGGGVMDLLEWFEDPDRAGAAAELVEQVSPSALPTIASGYGELGPAARLGVLEAINPQWAEVLGPLVEAAARTAAEQDRPGEFAALVGALTPLAAPPDSAVGRLLHGWALEPVHPAVTDVSTAVLARAGESAAVADLVEILVEVSAAAAPVYPWTDVDLTGWIREGMRRSVPHVVPALHATLEALDPDEPADVLSALTLLYLLPYGMEEPAVLDLAASWSVALWDAVPALWCRHHLLGIAHELASLGDDRGVDLAALAFEDEALGPPLRRDALRALVGADGGTAEIAVPVAAAALDDPDPGVRATAAECLRHLAVEDADVLSQALSRARSDAWPEVRLSALKLVAVFDDVAVEHFHDFLVDPDSDVRKQAIRMVMERGIATDEVGILLANTTVDASMRGDVRAEAAHAIGSLCLVELAQPLGNVLYYGIVPGAGEADILAASAAADALGRLGEAGPLDKLILATRPGLRLQIRLAAIRALGLIAHPDAREPLETLSASVDPVIAEAAAAALELVETGTSGAACRDVP